MSVSVKIPTQLREATGGEALATVDGATVGEVLDSLYERYGELRNRIAEDGGLRRFVNVYVGEEDIRFLDYLDTARLRRRRGHDPAGGRWRGGVGRLTSKRAPRARRRKRLSSARERFAGRHPSPSLGTRALCRRTPRALRRSARRAPSWELLDASRASAEEFRGFCCRGRRSSAPAASGAGGHLSSCRHIRSAPVIPRRASADRPARGADRATAADCCKNRRAAW